MRGLAQSVFDDLLELDSRGRREIDYENYGRHLVGIWRHWLSLQAQVRRLRVEAEVIEDKTRPYL